MCSPTIAQSAEHVEAALVQWFEEYGTPKIIRTDNGGPFITQGNIHLIFPYLFRKKNPIRNPNENS